MTSVLVDTSFLVTLFDATRPNHRVAKRYYKHMLDAGIPMYFSAIVVSEISIKQPISDFELHNFRTLPFNIRHGIRAGVLASSLHRDTSDSRTAVRDDVKLIAQADVESIGFIITDDTSTLYKYCSRLKDAGHSQVGAIKLDAGYDESSFRLDGQFGLQFGDAEGQITLPAKAAPSRRINVAGARRRKNIVDPESAS